MAFGSRDPLCLELDINVSENEMSSIDDDLRPTFYPGMSCPVDSCHGKSYQSINTLWKHWKKIHREKVPLFKCTFQLTNGLCGFVSTDVGVVRKHHLKNHKQHEYMKISKEIVVNKKFISPGDAKCTKKPRNLNVNGRDAAAAERRSQPVVGNIQIGNSVNRDKSVILTERTIHGQVQYKAYTYMKKHWQPKFQRK